MAKRLIWSRQSQGNKKEIFDYWNDRNKSREYSRKLDELFNTAAELLVLYPNLGKKTDIQNIRIKLVRNYLMIYKITTKEIQIMAVWDGHRNPKEFEKLLKTIE